jgi:beta-lactamase class A
MFKEFNIRLAIFTVLVFIVGVGVGAYTVHKNFPSIRFRNMSGWTYQFINPQLAYSDDVASELKPFKPDIESLIKNKVDNNQATNVSVYFRDMNNGPWFGIGESDPYVPASLLKVPVMMDYLKASEKKPGLLDQQIKFETKTDEPAPHYPPEESLEIGKSYSVRDLIEHMIKYSDNQALGLLADNAGRIASPLQTTINDLGQSYDINDPDSTISVRSYSVYFRILYNSSFLNKDNSEYALKLLSQADFRHGIQAGLPEDVMSANKFGERTVQKDGQTINQLHDCGIIYLPHRPYLLCVMTRGNNFDDMAHVISDVSKAVYEKVSSQTK